MSPAGERFRATGLMVLERNWLDVYPYSTWGGNANLPALKQGDTFVPTELRLREVSGVGRWLLSPGKYKQALPCDQGDTAESSLWGLGWRGAERTACCHLRRAEDREVSGVGRTAPVPINPNPPLSRPPQGATEPPPRLSERDLISKMESYGIGTDATVAEHIQKQLERGYAVKDEGTLTFWPTPLGEH